MWWLKEDEREWNIDDKEINGKKSMCGVLTDRRRDKGILLVFSLHETINQSAMANSVSWCGHMLGRMMVMFREGHWSLEKGIGVLEKVLEFVEGH